MKSEWRVPGVTNDFRGVSGFPLVIAGLDGLLRYLSAKENAASLTLPGGVRGCWVAHLGQWTSGLIILHLLLGEFSLLGVAEQLGYSGLDGLGSLAAWLPLVS